MRTHPIIFVSVLFLQLCLPFTLVAQTDTIPFDEAYWDLSDATVSEYLGRQTLTGAASLKEFVFENGVIEVDICTPDVRQRAYPGVYFRVQDDSLNGEHLYIRPHRAPIYSDALQYAPFCNGASCWQFCNGPGYTARLDIPADVWNRLRIEVQGHQARIYWNDLAEPVLTVTDLRKDIGPGGIALSRGPGAAPVYFSNFRVFRDDRLTFDDPLKTETPEGTVMEWEVSRPFPADELDVSEMKYPRFFVIAAARWCSVRAEPSGLVNISKLYERTRGQPDIVYARTVFQSDRKQDIRLDFGYSDEVMIFLNGKPQFHGISHYTRRDPSFLGIVGYHDDVHLTLEKGRNEIFFAVKEWFGGWGFQAKTSIPLKPLNRDHSRLEKVWEASEGLFTPESVVYDRNRGVLYATNFNPRFKMDAEESEYVGYISKLDLNGDLLEQRWAAPLHAPTGMLIHKNKLYTLERRAMAVIDLDTGAIIERHPIPDCQFPNDLAVDRKGNIYISDTAPAYWGKSKIYKFSDGHFDVWLDGYDAWRPNGMFFHDGKLIFGGAAGDPFVKTVDLKTRHIERIASLGAGTIDGFRIDGSGNVLVSHWEGRIYSVTPDGDVTELLDSGGRFSTADFEYIRERRLLIIPTFFQNSIIAFRLGE